MFGWKPKNTYHSPRGKRLLSKIPLYIHLKIKNMLQNTNTQKTEKDLKFLLGLNTGFSILAACLLILFNAISYYLSGNFLVILSIIFMIIFFVSLQNVDNLKKKLKK